MSLNDQVTAKLLLSKLSLFDKIVLYEECSETSLTYSFILSNTIEITPICVPVHRDSSSNISEGSAE